MICHIAATDRGDPQVLREIEQALAKKHTTTAEAEIIVKILDLAERASERQLIEALENEAPGEIITFYSIVLLSDSDVQQVLREADSGDIAKALKAADTRVQDKIFNSMPGRAATKLKKNMENMGPVMLKSAEESQEEIISIVCRLKDAGKITIDKTRQVGHIQNKDESKKDHSNTIDGIETGIEILILTDACIEKRVIDYLESKAPDLAGKIISRLFSYLVLYSDDLSIQIILRKLDSRDLCMALKSAEPEVQDKIFRNFTEEGVTTFKEEMESMGPVKLKEVEAARKIIFSISRDLELNGDIFIFRGDDVMVV